MKNIQSFSLRKWLAKAMATLLVISSFSLTAFAQYYDASIKITDISLNYSTIDFYVRPSLGLTYKTNAEGYVTITVYKDSKKVGTVQSSLYLYPGSHTLSWNGKYGTDTEVGTSGNRVENGTYSFKIYAVNAKSVASGTSNSDTQTSTFQVATTTQSGGSSGTGNTYYAPSVKITNTSISPNPVDLAKNTSVAIAYTTNAESVVTLQIYKKLSTSSKKRIGTFIDNQTLSAGSHAFRWNLQYGDDNEIGTTGTKVDSGTYYYSITATNTQNVASGASNQDTKTENIYVNSQGSTSALQIVSIKLSKSSFNPANKESEKFTFELNKDAYVTLEIFDENDDLVTTVKKSQFYDSSTTQTITWDGKDEDKNVMAEGKYTYKLTAKSGSESDYIDGAISISKIATDETEDPNLKNVYVTKDSFDPALENTYIVFNVTATSDINVTLYDSSDDKVEELYDVNSEPSGQFKIKWDGSDVDEGKYTYKILVENDYGKDNASGTIEVKKDTVTSSKPNITKDKVNIDDLPYDPKAGTLDISFKLDRDAEVSLSIYQGNSLIVNSIKDEELSSGVNTLKWDGKDKNGDYIDDEGVYQYRLTAKNSNGSDVEKGNFNLVKSVTTPTSSTKCGGFTDVKKDYQYCAAIEWTKAQKIFKGYDDGAFRPYQSISRVEALKVILEAFDAPVVGASGNNLGFKDVNVYDWYLGYLETAVALGIVKGYSDRTFKPDNTVTRAEGLKIMLETAHEEFGTNIPSTNVGRPYRDIEPGEWFIKYVWFARENSISDDDNYFYPYSALTRGGMADMLYRFHSAGLDQP